MLLLLFNIYLIYREEQLANCACSALRGPLLSTSLPRLREHVEKEAEIVEADGCAECWAMLPSHGTTAAVVCLRKIKTGNISNNEWGGAAAVPPPAEDLLAVDVY